MRNTTHIEIKIRNNLFGYRTISCEIKLTHNDTERNELISFTAHEHPGPGLHSPISPEATKTWSVYDIGYCAVKF